MMANGGGEKMVAPFGGGGGGDGAQWTPFIPSVLPWSSVTPSITSQVVHFTGTPSMASLPVVHFSGTPTMTSQALHSTATPTMTSRVVNFTGTPTMTSQVVNFTAPVTSQLGGPSHLGSYGFDTGMTSSQPYRPLIPPKRKCPLAWEEIPPPKLHITDEQMACRMKGLQISQNNELLTQQTSQDDVTLPSLVVCDEIRQLRMPNNILPAELLAKLESPSKALVVWKPPEQRAAELLQQTLKNVKEKDESKNKEESEMLCSSFQSDDKKEDGMATASTSTTYSFQPHPALPNFSLDAFNNNNNTLFEAPQQQLVSSGGGDVEDMALDVDV
ncbi:uncharacterized protein LOC111048734 isoform X1 [Nilaparvata lugens]|uniref:uncharacterized protein LOC111048734 isoform X1 n=1 Tax=Nilaparvata lugens TaxID=108931 RepID=UPI00193CD1EF|nr:uncharacterized protein LOC111048734 isoform X1 [Nilaparvata lugens]